VHWLATDKRKVSAEQYQKNVIDYVTEWEQIVTTRVDEGSKETYALHRTLNHYQSKIDPLRKKVNAIESKGKGSPAKLSEKLVRNEGKLDEAWKLYETNASIHCNLLEEVTKHGWKDLYPLVKASLEWEAVRAAGENDVYAKLSEVEKNLTSVFEKNLMSTSNEKKTVAVVTEAKEEPSGGPSTAVGDHDLDTTGSVNISSSDDSAKSDDDGKPADSAAKSKDNEKADDDVKPANNAKSDDDDKPAGSAKFDDDVKPADSAKPADDDSSSDDSANSEDDVKPADSANSEDDDSSSDDSTKSEDDVKPASAPKFEEDVKPAEAPKSEDDIKPTDVAKSDDDGKPADSTKS
jgi:hypothetical protein